MGKKKGKRGKPYRLIPLVVALALFSLTLCSCVGAPRSKADFEAMDTERYESWRDRVAAVHEEAAYAVVSHSASNAETVDRLHGALTALSGKPVPAGSIKALADQPEFAGLLRIALLELTAYLGDGGLDPTPRLADLFGAVAAGLVAGKDRALAEARASPPPDPETGP